MVGAPNSEQNAALTTTCIAFSGVVGLAVVGGLVVVIGVVIVVIVVGLAVVDGLAVDVAAVQTIRNFNVMSCVPKNAMKTDGKHLPHTLPHSLPHTLPHPSFTFLKSH